MRIPLLVLLVVITFCTMVAAPAWSQSSSGDAQLRTAPGVGMEVAAAAATILYFPFKAAFAIGGGIVGGLAYVFSGLNETTAKNIWIPSMLGTYVITPEHLAGERPVRFLGITAESEERPHSPAVPHD